MNIKTILSVMLTIFSALSMSLNAQIKIAENGNVGIGNNAPLSKLAVNSAGMDNAKAYIYSSGQYNTGSGEQYGLYSLLSYGPTSGNKCAIYGLSKAFNSTVVGVKGEALPINSNYRNVNTFGVYGIAGNGVYGKNYGVFGMLQDGENSGAGVYGTHSGTIVPLSDRYAGYFYGKSKVEGDFFCTNLQNTSDARLKTNIIDIKCDVMLKLKDLHPVQFQWQQVEDVVTIDTVTMKTPHFSSDIDFDKNHYGLLAQEVQKIFPDLVHESGDGYLSLNYIELIPLLIQAVQELSSEVESLKRNEVAHVRQNAIMESAVLYQNNPNPFSSDTRIEYKLPQTTKAAFLYIFNMNGSLVAEYPILSFGNSSIAITAGQLAAGMYQYSLVADGQIIETKSMILTR